jgi:hypothetical protein
LAALFLIKGTVYLSASLIKEAALLAFAELMVASILQRYRLTYGLAKTLRSQDCIKHKILEL